MPTKAELQEDLDHTRDALARMRQEHEDFKKQVAEKAVAVAAEENWCDAGLRAALEELGLDVPTGEFTGMAHIKVRFKGRTTRQNPEHSWVAESIEFDPETLAMDGDWESGEFELEGIEVQWVEEVV